MKQDIKTFQNQQSYWEHNGSFSVELMPTASRAIAPESVEFKDNVAYIRSGRVKQTMGGIQLYSDGMPFYWGYPHIKVIRDGNGDLLWVNYSYR